MRLTEEEREFVRALEPISINDTNPICHRLEYSGDKDRTQQQSWEQLVRATRCVAGRALYPDFVEEPGWSSETEWKDIWPRYAQDDSIEVLNALNKRSNHLVWIAARWQRRFGCAA